MWFLGNILLVILFNIWKQIVSKRSAVTIGIDRSSFLIYEEIRRRSTRCTKSLGMHWVFYSLCEFCALQKWLLCFLMSSLGENELQSRDDF